MQLVPYPLLYVIVLNWNLKEDTLECLGSLFESDFPSFRVLVVDNASTDGSPEAVRTHFPRAEILVNDENLGFAAGNNIGIAYALEHGAEYVLILNNDTVVDRDLLTRLMETAQAHPEAGILGPAILYYEDRNRVWHLGDRIHPLLPVPVSICRNQREGRLPREPFSVDYVSGCGMLVKAEVFATIGAFDARYSLYYEDADFCRRAREAGFGILAVPQARMWHKVSRSARRELALTRYQKGKNRARFYRCHRHGPSPLLTTLYLAWSGLIIAAGDILRGEAHLAGRYLAGLWDGYRGASKSQ